MTDISDTPRSDPPPSGSPQSGSPQPDPPQPDPPPPGSPQSGSPQSGSPRPESAQLDRDRRGPALLATPVVSTGVNGERSASRRTARSRRDRHGRGLRTPLLPAELPAARTRAQQFDHAVLEAVADLEERWPTELSAIEFAVDEVPSLPGGNVVPSSDVVLDGGVPLTRFSPPGVDAKGRATKARVVVYRRPLEVRAADSSDLGDLVAEVLGEQLTAVLGEGGDEPPG